MSRDQNRRRAIQETLLRDLRIRYEAAPGLPLLWAHLLYGFQTATVPYTEEEIRAALADLVERGFATASNEAGAGDLPEKGYVLTADGRDFLDARCPWHLVDRFSPKGGPR